jgi:hypothetical protein
MLALLLDTFKYLIIIDTSAKLSLCRNLHISEHFIAFPIMLQSQIYVNEIVTIVCLLLLSVLYLL